MHNGLLRDLLLRVCVSIIEEPKKWESFADDVVSSSIQSDIPLLRPLIQTISTSIPADCNGQTQLLNEQHLFKRLLRKTLSTIIGGRRYSVPVWTLQDLKAIHPQSAPVAVLMIVYGDQGSSLGLMSKYALNLSWVGTVILVSSAWSPWGWTKSINTILGCRWLLIIIYKMSDEILINSCDRGHSSIDTFFENEDAPNFKTLRDGSPFNIARDTLRFDRNVGFSVWVNPSQAYASDDSGYVSLTTSPDFEACPPADGTLFQESHIKVQLQPFWITVYE